MEDVRTMLSRMNAAASRWQRPLSSTRYQNTDEQEASSQPALKAQAGAIQNSSARVFTTEAWKSPNAPEENRGADLVIVTALNSEREAALAR